jgi:hypothetical protein
MTAGPLLPRRARLPVPGQELVDVMSCGLDDGAHRVWLVLGSGPLKRCPPMAARVESRMGAGAGGQWPSPRFPSPLIEPDMRH